MIPRRRRFCERHRVALSALELVCIMYAGFKRIEPVMDIGVDLGEVWWTAERLS